MRITLRFDMRQPDPRVSRASQYAAMLDMCAWADGLGLDEVYVSEHHAAEDGYLPSPIVLGSAVAARTQRIGVHLSALVVTLHHPLRLAEDLAILDIISNGRLAITAGMGYRPHEFEMFGVDIKKRLRTFLDTLETLRRAWTGEPFEFEGRTVRVTPKPVQPGGPLLIMGGSTAASAERAARMGLPYKPGFPPDYEIYKREVAKLGRPEPAPLPNQGPNFLYVTDDPDRDWPVVGPHALYQSNSYVQWAAERGSGDTPYKPIASLAEARANPTFQITTPGQVVAYARTLEPHGELTLQPLFGGLDPGVAWKSLRLFEQEVLPRMREAGLR